MDSGDRMDLEYEEDHHGGGSDTEEDAAIRDQTIMAMDYDYEREVEEIEDANAINAYHDCNNENELYKDNMDNDYYDHNNLDNYYRNDFEASYFRSDITFSSNRFQNFQSELQMIQGYFQELASEQRNEVGREIETAGGGDKDGGGEESSSDSGSATENSDDENAGEEAEIEEGYRDQQGGDDDDGESSGGGDGEVVDMEALVDDFVEENKELNNSASISEIVFKKRVVKNKDEKTSNFKWGKAAQRVTAKSFFGNLFKSKPKEKIEEKEEDLNFDDELMDDLIRNFQDAEVADDTSSGESLESDNSVKTSSIEEYSYSTTDREN